MRVNQLGVFRELEAKADIQRTFWIVVERNGSLVWFGSFWFVSTGGGAMAMEHLQARIGTASSIGGTMIRRVTSHSAWMVRSFSEYALLVAHVNVDL